MSNPWPDLYDEIRTALVAVWPEVENNGIFETSELQQHSRAKVTLPLAILHRLESTRDQEFQPLGFQCYAVTMAIHYLGRDMTEDEMRVKLDALEQRLLTVEMAEGKAQVIAVEAVEPSDEQGGNQVYITKNLVASAGTVLVRFLVGKDVHH
jgi:hypothetical protein